MTPVPRAKWLPAVAVLGVAITWGVSFAVVKATVGEVSPSRLVGWRFALATLTLLTLRPRALGDLDRQIVGRGIVLGALLGIGFVLCTIGMQTTSVLISAFVTGQRSLDRRIRRDQDSPTSLAPKARNNACLCVSTQTRCQTLRPSKVFAAGSRPVRPRRRSPPMGSASIRRARRPLSSRWPGRSSRR